MLFNDENFYMLNNGYDINYDFVNYMNPQKTDSSILYSVYEGFIRGNMFKNLYDSYRGLEPLTPKIKTEREKMLFDVSKYDFAINDLNLYLDLHPEDNEMFLKFKEYVQAYLKHKKEYEEKYGPLCLTEDLGSRYLWNKNPWPWDKEDRYV